MSTKPVDAIQKAEKKLAAALSAKAQARFELDCYPEALPGPHAQALRTLRQAEAATNDARRALRAAHETYLATRTARPQPEAPLAAPTTTGLTREQILSIKPGTVLACPGSGWSGTVESIEREPAGVRATVYFEDKTLTVLRVGDEVFLTGYDHTERSPR